MQTNQYENQPTNKPTIKPIAFNQYENVACKVQQLFIPFFGVQGILGAWDPFAAFLTLTKSFDKSFSMAL